MSTATASPPTEATEEAAAAKGSKKKLILIALVVVLVAAGAWFVLLRPHPPADPKPGEVVPLEAIQVNLTGGHYLRLGLALQLTSDAKEADGSKALDAAISVFSGRSVEDLTAPGERKKLKSELEHRLEEAYEGEVMGVYFTEFVTQ